MPLPQAYSLRWRLPYFSQGMHMPAACHSLCLQLSPPPAVRSAAAVEWFPTHVAHWPNIEMIQSVAREQPAGRPESP